MLRIARHAGITGPITIKNSPKPRVIHGGAPASQLRSQTVLTLQQIACLASAMARQTLVAVGPGIVRLLGLPIGGVLSKA
eukprot:4830591-Lingulodinium_polyedra.AAC.1